MSSPPNTPQNLRIPVKIRPEPRRQRYSMSEYHLVGILSDSHLAVLSAVVALFSSLRSTKTRSMSDALDSLRHIKSPWTTSWPPPILRALGDCLYILLLWARFQHLRLSTPDDEPITLSFCRVETLKYRIKTVVCGVVTDFTVKLTGSHGYT